MNCIENFIKEENSKFILHMITTENELKTFQQNLKSKINLDSDLKIEVHRSAILADSFSNFQNIQPTDLLKKIVINFIGEENNNNEESKNEWFTLLAKELVNVDNKLFIPTANGNAYQPNSFINNINQHIDYYKFAGQFVALSVINGIPINIHFAPFFLKHVLHHPINFKDIEDIDLELYSSLQYMISNDVSSLDHTFSINNKNLNCNMTIELKPGGTLIKVTNDNKKEYVNLVTDYLLQKSIIDQIRSFCEGFDSLIPHEDIRKLTSKDLDLLIYGADRIDIEDLIANITLISPYTPNTPVIKFFF